MFATRQLTLAIVYLNHDHTIHTCQNHIFILKYRVFKLVFPSGFYTVSYVAVTFRAIFCSRNLVG